MNNVFVKCRTQNKAPSAEIRKENFPFYHYHICDVTIMKTRCTHVSYFIQEQQNCHCGQQSVKNIN